MLSGKRRIFAFGSACVACTYPLALIPVVMLDYLIGENEFLRFLMVADAGETFGVFVGDWFAALPVVLVFWLVARGAIRLIGPGYFQLIAGAVVICGSILAMRAPYLPMIFPSMLLVVALLNIPYERRRALG